MNKIDELIQQYCPDGVGYVKLGDVVSISRGASPRPIQNYLTDEEDGIPWIKIGDVSTNSKYITSTDERITREGANKSRFLKKGTFILSNSMSFGRPYILGIDGCIHDGWISICDFEASLNSDFLYYLLRSSDVQGYWISKANSGGAVANLNSDIVRSTPIPLPPLPVQEEIVNILDRFTVYAAELQAELQARQQQYNYYRDTLLSFEGREDVQEYILGDLFEFKNGLNASKEQFGHGTPIVNYVNVYKKNSIKASDLSGKVELDKSSIDRYRVKRGDVFFTRTSETREEIGIASVLLEDIEDCVFSGFVLRARPITDVLLPEFCKYCFSTYNIRKQIIQSSTLTTRALTNGTSLSKVKVLIPSKPEQQRIVDILDRFDHLTNDLSQGLPAEIEARQQQYEYYRDQLLTFKRKEA